jgi:hypothetical protein
MKNREARQAKRQERGSKRSKPDRHPKKERRSRPSKKGRLAKKAGQLNWSRISDAIGKAREAGVDFSPKLQTKIKKKISRKPGGKLV